MVRALASHQCGPGSTPGPGVICGLSLLLVLVLAPRGLSPVTPVFPSPQKPTSPNSNLIFSLPRISSALVHGYKIETIIIKLFVCLSRYSPLAFRQKLLHIFTDP